MSSKLKIKRKKSKSDVNSAGSKEKKVIKSPKTWIGLIITLIIILSILAVIGVGTYLAYHYGLTSKFWNMIFPNKDKNDEDNINSTSDLNN